MVRRSARRPTRAVATRTAGHGLQLDAGVVGPMRAQLPRVADDVVAAITAEVPSYENALAGPMGETIRNAVQLALGGFLSLATGRRGSQARTPTAPAVEGAYQLGRGEARAGRSTDALLSAYRIGARVSWRELSSIAVEAQLPAETLVAFAELVFAYIDELSASSAAGHADELESSDRARERQRERLARQLVDRRPPEVLEESAGRAEWTPPATLTAVVVPQAQVRPVLASLPPETLGLPDPPGVADHALLLVPDVHGHRRAALLAALRDRGAVWGPARPWREAAASWDRARRARDLGLAGDTEDHLVALVLTADAEALDDLRARALAPLDDLRPTSREKLVETLRAWLLHHGRRDAIAGELFVHPQTVRYRVGQLREVYGDALEDPTTVLALTLALGLPPGPPAGASPTGGDPAGPAATGDRVPS